MDHHSKAHWHKGVICLTNSSGLSFSNIKVCLLRPQVFHQSYSGKRIFVDYIEMHQANWDHIDSSLMSLSQMFQLVKIQGALKLRRRNWLFLGERVNCTGGSHVTHAIINNNPKSTNHLVMNLIPTPSLPSFHWKRLQFKSVWTSERTHLMEL